MLVPNKNKQLYQEYEQYITNDAARVAFHVMVGAAAAMPKFNCYPEEKEKRVVRDFRYYDISDEQHPFAFIPNRGSLLFYLRPPAVRSKKYAFKDIQNNFSEVNENNAGEWTIRINNRDDAIKVIETILLKW